ncbi:MAG TPA: type II and III secretion system protein, partial [Rhodothermales bacterium]|nr:type II and III secretion system protein [Rhodothermales bacterium]
PFNEFIQLINPIFLRVTGKRVVDPMDRTEPIGVSLNGVHFIDAFELVLDRAALDFRESADYFVVENPEITPTSDEVAAAGVPVQVLPTALAAGGGTVPATAESREIRIDAIIFEVNNTRVRELGTNWSTLFAQASSSSGSGTGTGGTGTGTGTGSSGSGAPQLSINASSFFEAIDGIISSSTDQLELGFLLGLFRYFETQGIGRTLASPSVTVQSGQQGRIQSGSDIPINIQDFQGNTITQFISTGVIIDVTPTLIIDTSGDEPVEFVHLDVKVERSAGRPTAAGIVIDKNNVDTQVLLVDGEQTVIGGLTSTEESVERRGVPILRDIPLLNFFFSYKNRTLVQKELMVVLQVRVVDPVRERQGRPAPADLYRQYRDRTRGNVDQFRPGTTDELQVPPADTRRPTASAGVPAGN